MGDCQTEIRLEHIYWKLQDRFPGKYDIKQMKDCLFYGMSQHLRDLMRFLYKREETSYEELLEASQEAEGEWTEGKMAWVKNARLNDENGLKALREQINTLASALNTTRNNNPNGGSKAKTDTNQGVKRGSGQNGKLKDLRPAPMVHIERDKNLSSAINVVVGAIRRGFVHHQETKTGGL